MSKSVTIPSFNDPFVVEVNNVKYSYPAGSTQTVPDEVAVVIDNINANMPKEAEEPGKQGQVWTRQEKGAAWQDLPEVPVNHLYQHNINLKHSEMASGYTYVTAVLVSNSPTALTFGTFVEKIYNDGFIDDKRMFNAGGLYFATSTSRAYLVSGVYSSDGEKLKMTCTRLQSAGGDSTQTWNSLSDFSDIVTPIM